MEQFPLGTGMLKRKESQGCRERYREIIVWKGRDFPVYSFYVIDKMKVKVITGSVQRGDWCLR